MGLSFEKGHIAGLQIFLLNLSLATTLGLFAGLTLRSLVLLALDRARPALVWAVRGVAAAAFLASGYVDLLFSKNMVVWDGPPRAVVTACAAALPIIALARHKRGTAKPPDAPRGFLLGISFVGLCLFTVLTLLRAGTVALTGDRVTLTLEVTGETRTENRPIAAGSRTPQPALHRVELWLPSGVSLADVWLPGNRMRVNGQILRISSTLNDFGFPNLYRFVSIESGPADPAPEGELIRAEVPFPEGGPLAVHPWWRSIQNSILSDWQEGTSENSFWGLRMVPNASPFYPLEDSQRRPITKTFLLVLPPSGLATSRGSSPLEKADQPSR